MAGRRGRRPLRASAKRRAVGDAGPYGRRISRASLPGREEIVEIGEMPKHFPGYPREIGHFGEEETFGVPMVNIKQIIQKGT